MSFARRFLPLACAAALLFAALFGAGAPASAQDAPLQLGTAAIPFNRADAADLSVGRLRWRGGLVYSAGAPEFGGWSDLNISRDGRVFSAVSEEATWMTAVVEYDAEGNLAGLSGARIGPLRGLNGKPITGRSWTTAESLARLADGSWIVSFERNHRIWRYKTLDGMPEAIEGPADIARQPLNAGIKGMSVRTDGSIIALSEDYSQQPAAVVGWIGTPAGGNRYTWQAFHYAVSAGFRPTAVAGLPDGSFVMLERAIDARHGARSRLVHVTAEQLKPGATLRGEEVGVLQSPHPSDNFEGLSATRGNRGETLLLVNSNDNFNPLQRNLLLMFELLPQKEK